MKHYIGIDLGTTNSSVCSYDGQTTRIWKSPEQNDVTPSAIYVDKRGNRYYGAKAYNQAPYNPDNSATLFKRFMGTSTKIELESAGLSLTPEECSAEILKVLMGYLPEEIRDSSDTAVVITVPAAFNQMKKDATLQAAKLAGIENVALMQEPVAAIMSIMRSSKQEGIFLVYDLGGGTFDVSIAENINGKVSLLAHGGVEMCGGRDIDKMIFNHIILPWMKNKFSVP
ncbi:MAG: Hsp70 family protein, partial [Clostridia bacterium]